VKTKEAIVIALICSVIALAACRREVGYYPPLKLGGDVTQAEQQPGPK
jgi:hypothetical protein